MEIPQHIVKMEIPTSFECEEDIRKLWEEMRKLQEKSRHSVNTLYEYSYKLKNEYLKFYSEKYEIFTVKDSDEAITCEEVKIEEMITHLRTSGIHRGNDGIHHTDYDGIYSLISKSFPLVIYYTKHNHIIEQVKKYLDGKEIYAYILNHITTCGVLNQNREFPDLIQHDPAEDRKRLDKILRDVFTDDFEPEYSSEYVLK
jgi:hypothetical protein